MKTAVGYIRVSTDKQEEYSPESQKALLKEYAAKNGMVISNFYEELGISGKSAEKRPMFNQMMLDARDKQFDVVLVWKFSRFARNQSEASYYKAMLRKKLGIEVISVSEPITDDMSGRLVEMIIEWTDENYIINLSQEVKRGMTQKALQGGYNGRPPIGYRKERGPHTIPYIDEEYAPMVRQIFKWFSEDHLPVGDIAYRVNELGYRTRSGKKWESRNIIDMIQNPFYIGKIRWNNTENRSRTLTGETIIADGKHEPLIDLDMWNMANEYYKSIKKPYKKRAAASAKHWLSGIIVCAECGASFSHLAGKSGNKSWPFFRCHNYGKGLCSAYAGNSINEKNAVEAVMRGLRTAINDDTIHIVERHAEIISFTAESIKKKLALLSTKEARIKEAYMAGIDTLDEYANNKKLIAEERAKLESKLKETPQQPQTVKEVQERIHSLYEYLLTDDDMANKANAIRSVVDKIVYDKSTDTMEFYFYF